MYKVLLVDDEPWALKGVREFFEWEQEGFEVIAETTRSVEALEIILTKKPDVVFTDIRMPTISGIELMQKVREEGLDTEFIIVSGYSEFSYAQKGLQLGAFDYCLKPIDTDYTTELLQRIAAHLHKKNNIKNHRIFEAIIDNNEDLGMLLVESGLGTSHPYYQAIIIQAKKDIDFSRNISSKISFDNKSCITLGRDKFLFIVNTDNDISDSLSANFAKDVVLGFSSLSESYSDALKLYSQASIAIAGSFINDEATVFKYGKKDTTILNEEIGKIASLLQSGNIQNLQQSIGEIPFLFINKKLGMEELVYFWNKLVAIATEYMGEGNQSSIFEFMDYSQLMNQFEDMPALCECLSNELACLVENTCDNILASENMNRDFQKLFAYIKEHFTEQIFLKDLSRTFFINQNYVCNLFKKYTGGTFSEYINGLRIAKSKELLEDVNLTIEEVAQKSGYNDYYYFNKLFKKHFGTTPAKYRKDLASSKSPLKGMIKNGLS